MMLSSIFKNSIQSIVPDCEAGFDASATTTPSYILARATTASATFLIVFDKFCDSQFFNMLMQNVFKSSFSPTGKGITIPKSLPLFEPKKHEPFFFFAAWETIFNWRKKLLSSKLPKSLQADSAKSPRCRVENCRCVSEQKALSDS